MALGCALIFTLFCGLSLAAETHWYKGNLHCHSLWSDGNSFPEYVVDWYKSRGYNFLALTDHNKFATAGDGEYRVVIGEPPAPKAAPAAKKATPAAKKKNAAVAKGKKKAQGPKVASPEAFERYQKLVGPQGIDEKTEGGRTLVRLKTYDEIKPRFDDPGKFLLLPGEEITCPPPKGTDYRVHVCTVNLTKQIEAPNADAIAANQDTWQANTAGKLVAAHSKETGLVMHAHLNHPLWSHFQTGQVCLIDALNQMEINNDDSGSSATEPQTEKLWDTVIAYRIAHGKPLMFGMAVDDAHSHLTADKTPFGAGHGWVMVRAESLTPENIVKAVDAGDFYASRGPELSEIKNDKQEMSLKIVPQPGVTYQTEFIGLRPGGQPGEVFATSQALNPVYKIKGDEVYVRAKVTSSATRLDKDGKPAYFEMAWTQPYQPVK